MVKMGFSLPIKGIRVVTQHNVGKVCESLSVVFDYTHIQYSPFKKRIVLHGIDGWDFIINHVDPLTVRVRGNTLFYNKTYIEIVPNGYATLETELIDVIGLIIGSNEGGEICNA